MNQETPISLNIRFVAWFLQFSGLILGWVSEDGSWMKSDIPTFRKFLSMITLILQTTPNLISISQIAFADQKLLSPLLGRVPDGLKKTDVYMKVIARLVFNFNYK